MSHTFAFQFIAGKYEGGLFLIPDDAELLIGRGPELDIVLVEDMVSRRHANLTTHQGRLVLNDLGSTNGTYVNGERIEQCELEAQDRILIGTSILRVTTAAHVEALLRAEEEVTQNDEQPSGTQMQGALGEVPLPELLQLFANKRMTGLLQLQREDLQVELVLVDGAITHAGLAHLPELAADQVLVLALGLTQGSYRFEQPPEGFERPTTFEADNATLFKTAQQERVQVDAIRSNGWPDAAKLSLNTPQPKLWSSASLDAIALDTLQLALSYGEVGKLLNNAAHGPLLTLQTLELLLQRGVLRRTL